MSFVGLAKKPSESVVKRTQRFGGEFCNTGILFCYFLLCFVMFVLDDAVHHALSILSFHFGLLFFSFRCVACLSLLTLCVEIKPNITKADLVKFGRPIEPAKKHDLRLNARLLALNYCSSTYFITDPEERPGSRLPLWPNGVLRCI